MSLNDLMDELRAEYIQSFPQKIADITTYFQQKDLDNLINSFHKIKGSGKTYGIPEMSELGEHFERLLKEQKEAALPLVSKAILLIQRIHAKRLTHQEHILSSDPDYTSLPK